MFLRSVRPRPNGFIEPCLPSPAPKPPSGPGWIHEIKFDGFRLMALKARVPDKVPGTGKPCRGAWLRCAPFCGSERASLQRNGLLEG
jgi:hypothetical protein